MEDLKIIDANEILNSYGCDPAYFSKEDAFLGETLSKAPEICVTCQRCSFWNKNHKDRDRCLCEHWSDKADGYFKYTCPVDFCSYCHSV